VWSGISYLAESYMFSSRQTRNYLPFSRTKKVIIENKTW